MKKLLALLLSIVTIITCFSSVSLVAYAGTKSKTINSVVYKYTVSNKKVTIKKITVKNKAKTVKIPSKISGYPVTIIDQESFSDWESQKRNLTVRTVEIPDSVKTIKDYAFYASSMLETVKIGKGVTKIGEGAFANCNNVKKYVVNKKNKNFASLDDCIVSKKNDVLYNYPSGKSTKNLKLNKSIKKVNDYAFSCADKLESIDLNNVSTVSDAAFYGCAKLKTIKLGKNVKSFSANNVDGMIKLTTITVNSKNKNLSSKDGVLYNKKKTILVAYPPNKSGSSFTMPSTVTKLAEKAFFDAKNLRSVAFSKNLTTLCYASLGATRIKTCNFSKTKLKTIEDSVFSDSEIQKITFPNTFKSINVSTFENCNSLKEVNIPSGVESIDSYTFYYCNNLTKVTFEGESTDIKDDAIPNIEGLVIYGKSGSTAEEYAINNGFEFVEI